MICSSVNRFRFIVRLPLLGRTLNLSGGNLQWQVKVHYTVIRYNSHAELLTGMTFQMTS